MASVQNRNGILYTCATKVCLADSFGRSIIGYVIDEDNDKFIVLLENDTVVDITRPIFDVRCSCYVFDFCRNRKYSMSNYWPIRLKVNVSGAACFTLNRVVMKGNKVCKTNV